jgi:Ca-activated chloride channel family protein
MSLVAGSSVAQQKDSFEDKTVPPSAPDKDEAAIRLGTNLVLLDVTVLDSSNNTAVMDMGRNNFQILEDKSPQSIEFFAKEQVPVSVVLTIDTSGSMRLKLDTVAKAAVNLVKQSRCGDEIAVIEFKGAPELLEEFTADTHAVIDTLESLVAGNSTSMLDAVYVAADYTGEAKNRRRAMVIVTDGLDRENYYKFDEVVKRVQKRDVQIYLIGFTQDIEDSSGGLFTKSPKGKAEALLTKLAAETGGRAFFPKSLSEVETIAQQISTDLRTQYAIGYYSTNGKRDGSFRSVKVKITTADKRRLVARTRSGYYAPLEGTKKAEP